MMALALVLRIAAKVAHAVFYLTCSVLLRLLRCLMPSRCLRTPKKADMPQRDGPSCHEQAIEEQGACGSERVEGVACGGASDTTCRQVEDSTSASHASKHTLEGSGTFTHYTHSTPCPCPHPSYLPQSFLMALRSTTNLFYLSYFFLNFCCLRQTQMQTTTACVQTIA